MTVRAADDFAAIRAQRDLIKVAEDAAPRREAAGAGGEKPADDPGCAVIPVDAGAIQMMRDDLGLWYVHCGTRRRGPFTTLDTALSVACYFAVRRHK